MNKTCKCPDDVLAPASASSENRKLSSSDADGGSDGYGSGDGYVVWHKYVGGGCGAHRHAGVLVTHIVSVKAERESASSSSCVFIMHQNSERRGLGKRGEEVPRDTAVHSGTYVCTSRSIAKKWRK